jgi:hypothetical protein
MPMTEPAESSGPAPTEALVRQVERLWQQGERPDPDALLRAASVSAARAVAEVLAADQWQRWHAGERLPAEDYLARHPAVAADPEAALLLVYGEFLLREECGEAPCPQEYLARFPSCAEGLQRQLAFHGALGAAGPTLLAAPKAPAEPAVSAVPGYELLEEIGRGGMGVVYRAWQTGLHRMVALKMLRVLAAPELRARFRVEAEALALLQHPNIVAVHEVGGGAGAPFLAMEHLEGGNLAARLQGTPLPPTEAARLIETLARAVEYAHGRMVVHRDLTPANVLFAADGTPRISDFGLAKAPGRRQATDADRGHPGHAQLHAARAGRRRRPGGRAGGRYLRAGRHPVRVPHRPASLQGGDLDGNPAPGAPQRTGPARPARSQRAARPGDDLPQMPQQGAPAPLRLCPGAGGGPAPLPGG